MCRTSYLHDNITRIQTPFSSSLLSFISHIALCLATTPIYSGITSMGSHACVLSQQKACFQCGTRLQNKTIEFPAGVVLKPSLLIELHSHSPPQRVRSSAGIDRCNGFNITSPQPMERNSECFSV